MRNPPPRVVREAVGMGGETTHPRRQIQWSRIIRRGGDESHESLPSGIVHYVVADVNTFNTSCALVFTILKQREEPIGVAETLGRRCQG